MFTSFQRLSVIRQGEKGGGTRVAPLLAGRVGIPPALPHGAATFPLGVNKCRPWKDISSNSILDKGFSLRDILVE